MFYESLLSENARVMQPSPIRRMAAFINKPGVISFAGGVPNPTTFPEHQLKEIMDEIVESEGASIFQYGVTRGTAQFHEMIVEILEKRKIKANADELIVTTGSQQALDLISRIFIDPGDVILVELPSYIGAIACFRNCRAEMVGIRQDSGGIVVESLENKVKKLMESGKKVKFLYIIPNFQNPSGVTILHERRKKVIEIANRYGFLIVEDDPYRELYFSTCDPTNLMPLKSMPGGENIIYLSSFSKVVSPGLRTAFAVAPREITFQLELAKQAADLCSSSLDQRLILEYCRRGYYYEHVGRVRKFYEKKCSVMLSALSKYMPEEMKWTKPKGGMFVWLTMPAGIDSYPLAMESVEHLKVAFIHGEPFHVDGSGQNTLRLTFAKENEENIEKGISILGKFFKDKLHTL